uniref:NADH-ubiquinone oxidoreductase chain 4L n=1 Tax=Pelecotoma fennica TaxID=433262 RepID=A0A343A488_9CUCU|nr:NADH dehydrogenase subunit 4L [Pelecotoma fennica]AOY39366.1 NADH dehydrogenase subunit 4L [Pelecotoma fennica]
MFLGGVMSFGLKSKHLLLMLLNLEFLVLVVYLFMFFCLSCSGEYFFSVIFLVFSVCEGVVGLSVLVFLMRTCGNDNFQNLSVLW